MVLHASFSNLSNLVEVQTVFLSIRNYMNTYSKEVIPLLTVICALILCLCTRYFIEKLKLKFSSSPFMLITGIFIGYMFHLGNYNDIIEAVRPQHPKSLLIIVVPVMIYNMCVTFDTNLLAKSWGQIFVIALPGLLINVCMVALIFNRVSSHWYSTRGFLIAIMFAPVYPMDMMVYLKNVSAASRGVLTILQGESLVGTCIAFMLHHVVMETDLGIKSLWWQHLWIFIIYLVGGILVGYVSGKIMAHMLLFFSDDPIQTILISWVGPFLVYYVVTVTFGSCFGLLTLAIQGIIVAREKRSMSKESRRFLERFWNCLAIGCNSWGLFVVGMITGFETVQYAAVEDIAFIMLGYLINLVARLLEFLSIFYLLRIIGHSITFNHVIVLVWGGILSIINLTIMMQTYIEPEYRSFAKAALFHGSGAAILTMIINVSSIPYLLNCLELNTLSLIKQANMNKCIKHIMLVRNHVIAILKLERFFCDANWPFIQEATMITHPFKIANIKKYEELENELEFEKLAMCPACHREATIISTMKEFEDLIREARRRILKAKQVSYLRQYENGMLSLEAIRVLTNEVESAMESDYITHTENITRLFRPSKHLERFRLLLLRVFHDESDRWSVRRPRIKYRRICYAIVFNPIFDDTMCVIILLNTAMVIAELVLRFEHPEVWNRKFTRYLVFKSLSFVFCFVYVAEFIVKVLALSFVYIWKDGVKEYFRSRWRKFEFFCIIVSWIVVICEMMEIYLNDGEKQNAPSSFAVYICCLGAIRIVRIAWVVHRWHPFIEKCIDRIINNKATLAYNVGTGYITAEQDVLDLLATIVLKRELIEEMKLTVEADRLATAQELTVIQREKPWVAVNVKTREVTKTTLKGMYEAVTELKLMGWVDEVEREKLKKAIVNQEKNMRRLGCVPSNTPLEFFKNVLWMSKDDSMVNFLWSNSRRIHYEPGEYVCLENEKPDGVFVIISGLFKQIYKPEEEVLRNFYRCGNLPVVDFITSPDIDSRREGFFHCGNSFGELAILTQRPYSCNVRADCHSQVILIETEFIIEAMRMDNDPIDGLRARMWTAISLRLAYGILVKVPAYFEVPKKQIENSLLRAVVPDLDSVTIFNNNNMIEDVILINGLVMDFHSKTVYYAPCYIPRNVQKLVFPSSSIMDLYVNINEVIQTKLLLITENEVDTKKLMRLIEKTAEFLKSELYA